MFMTANEGTVDRAIRILAGVVILSLAFIGPRTAWGYLGIIPILTGALGYCPVYALLGINTCGIRKPGS
jgi:hypothetical protein